MSTGTKTTEFEERYIPFNGRSISRLHPNNPRQVISAASYAKLLTACLAKGGTEGKGVLTVEEWRALVERHFGKVFGAADRAPIHTPLGSQPKWVNQQAWGIVLCRKNRTVRTASKYIILLDDEVTNKGWILFAKEVQRKKLKLKKKKGKTPTPRVKKTPKA